MKEKYHPKAFLVETRNVRLGLLARSRIARFLEKQPSNAKNLAEETGMSYAVVLHHLHLFEAEKVVARKGKRPFRWELTGAGQQALIRAFLCLL
ncbi:MAG: winged helix-turn-helix domain-containing protein [Candidatus Bathyarchaeota archaeon]|nr:winged helix-turn-helix domain-containing protein [Candidatus Bathyarchaeota archaeon]